QNALKEGDSVVTGGGIFGTVKRIDMTSNKIEIEVARGVVITVDKGYVFADTEAMRISQNK
ncbi:preprotein translocase subunit YajC, partial [Prevotella aurantiaca]